MSGRLASASAFSKHRRAPGNARTLRPPEETHVQLHGRKTAMKTLIDTAAEAGRFVNLLNALAAASLTETLRGPGPYTLFAPTDKAFSKLPQGALNALLKDRKKLKGILEYHLLSGTLAGKAIEAGALPTVEGSSLVVAIDGVRITVNDARILETDIDATNGVIHVIDTVLLPKGIVLAAAA
jgi:uncharacterized surface protein with fasciclin (FAS1) repeats